MATSLKGFLLGAGFVMALTMGCAGDSSNPSTSSPPSEQQGQGAPTAPPQQTEFSYESNFPYPSPVVDVDGAHGHCSFSDDLLKVIYTKTDLQYEGLDRCHFQADYMFCDVTIDFSTNQPALSVACMM